MYFTPRFCSDLNRDLITSVNKLFTNITLLKACDGEIASRLPSRHPHVVL